MFYVEKYSHLYIGTITLHNSSYGTESYYARVGMSEHAGQAIRNKMACFSFTERDPAIPFLSKRARNYCNVGEKFFISSKCKTSRDLFRTSGYKIVRDRENADKTILRALPHVKARTTFVFDLAVRNCNNDLMLLTVKKEYDDNWTEITAAELAAIKYHFDSSSSIIGDGVFPKTKATLLPIDDDYEKYLSSDISYFTSHPFMFELDVPLSCPVEINLETLSLWKHCYDNELIAKAICNSNWQKYPCTLACFLSEEKTMIKYFGGANFKMILDQIGFDPYSSLSHILSGRIIEPDDWNLLQAYIMDKAGVPENGGYVSTDHPEITEDYLQLSRKRYVVAPLRLSAPMTFENIQSLLNN